MIVVSSTISFPGAVAVAVGHAVINHPYQVRILGIEWLPGAGGGKDSGASGTSSLQLINAQVTVSNVSRPR